MSSSLKSVGLKVKALKEAVKDYPEKIWYNDDIHQFSKLVYVSLFPKGTNQQYQAIVDTLIILKNKKVTKAALEKQIYRLVANKHFLKEGSEIPLWNGGWEDATMKCVGVTKAEPRKGKRYLTLHMKCILGIPAGLDFVATLSANVIEYIMCKYLCLSKTKPNAEELAGMIFKCLVQENLGGEAKLDHYSTTPALTKLNRDLADARENPKKCSQGTRPCYVCPKTRQQCPLAVWR